MTPAPTPPPNGRCARCAAAFHCGADDVAPCACTSVVLPPELLAQLQRQYCGCLCLRCLQALAAIAPAAP